MVPQREDKLWAGASVAFGILWLGGLGSVVALAAGGFAVRGYRRTNRRPVLPLIGIGLGVIGLLVALAMGAADPSTGFLPWGMNYPGS